MVQLPHKQTQAGMTKPWQLVVGVAVWASRTTAQPTPSRGDPPTVAPWKDYDPSVVRLSCTFFLANAPP